MLRPDHVTSRSVVLQPIVMLVSLTLVQGCSCEALAQPVDEPNVISTENAWESALLATYSSQFPLPTGLYKGIGEGTPIRRSLVARERELLAAAKRKTSAETLGQLGTLYTMVGDPSRGVAYLVASLDLDPLDGQVWMWLGANRLNQGKLEESVKLLEHAARIRKDDTHIYAYLGVAFMRSELDVEARKAFARAIELHPDNSDARAPLAELLEDSGELASARVQLIAAHTARPNYAPILFRLARVSRELGLDAEAKEYERLHERITILDDLALLYDTISEAQRRAQLGIVFLEDGRVDEALIEFEAALELDPESNVHLNALLGRAWSLVELERRSEGELATRELARLFPDHPDLDSLFGELEALPIEEE